MSSGVERRITRVLGAYTALIAVLGVVVAGTGDTRAASAQPATEIAVGAPAVVELGPAMAAGTHRATFRGSERSYTVRRPDTADRLPLLVALHGAGSSGADLERDSGLTAAVGDRAVVVYPEGLFQTWNAGGCCLDSLAARVDDVGFVSSLVTAAVDAGIADPDRVVVTGFSNGGMLAYHVLCAGPVRVRAVQVVGGALTGGCANDVRGASLVVVHDRADVMVKPVGYRGTLDNGQRLAYPSLVETVEDLRQRLGCAPRAAITERRRRTSWRWATCEAGGSLDVHLLDGVGHTWPGNRSVPAHANDPVDATALALGLLGL